MVRKTLITSAIALAVLAGGTSMAHAAGASQCQVIYGGGEVCPPEIKFTIDKKVQTPTKGGVFVDNITMNDSRFSPEQNVVYKVKVTNTGSQDLSNIKVTDNLPKYITYVSGDGNYNKDNNTLSVTINSLKKGESKEFTFTAKTAAAGSLPQDKAVICGAETTNKVSARVNEFEATDQAEICIEKGIVPGKVFETPQLKETPSTGPEMLSLAALVPMGALGAYFSRKSKISR